MWGVGRIGWKGENTDVEGNMKKEREGEREDEEGGRGGTRTRGGVDR